MARYSLIMTDEHYVKLAQRAIDTQKSMGRLINDAVALFLVGPVAEKPKEICAVCGLVGRVEATTYEQTAIYFCAAHSKYAKLFLGWRELETPSNQKLEAALGHRPVEVKP